ncbi:hypothetical protein QBC36DRAFT_166003, partial [Triangularia setosa]
LNRLPTAHNPDGMSPFEAFTTAIGLPDQQCIPQVHHLKAFGSTAFVHIRDKKKRPQARKMMARTVKGKLCGYEGDSSKIYRVWIESTNKIVRCRDARLSKTTFPMIP